MTDFAPAEILTFTRTLHAPAADVYRSFTDRDWITYWFCDDAHTRPAVGGHFLLTWTTGFFAQGSFAELEENRRIVLRWRGAGDAYDAHIDITLDESDGQTHVQIAYSDFPPEAADAITHEWESRLDNLVSALERGDDERITRRVILGIIPGTIRDDERAALGLAPNAAMKVDRLIEGFSAEAAGMQVGDIVLLVNGETVTNERPSFMILAAKGPGDTVPVVVLRGGQQHTLDLTLKGYPVPQSVDSWHELAERTTAQYAAQDDAITALITAAGEEAARRQPAAGEWSAVETLAHLILHERWLHAWLGGQVQGPEPTGYTCNHPALISGLLATLPTAAEVAGEYHRARQHTLALLYAFSANGSPRRAHLWWANFELDSLRGHTDQHIDQIRAALGE